MTHGESLVLIIDDHGIIQEVSQKFADWWNISRDYFIQKPLQFCIQESLNTIDVFKSNILTFEIKYHGSLAKQGKVTIHPLKDFFLICVYPQNTYLHDKDLKPSKFFIPLPYLIVNSQGQVLFFNETFEDTFLKKGDIILNKSLKLILSNKAFKNFQEALKQNTRDFYLHHGDKVFIIYKSRTLINSGDYYALIFIDYTEIYRVKDKLARSQRFETLGRLATTVSHDFNNILTAIIGFSNILHKQYSQRGEASVEINYIRDSAYRASKLVKQISLFSQEISVESNIFDVKVIIVKLMSIIEKILGNKIQLEIHYDTQQTFNIYFDQGQLEQVIFNLVSNARDAMPQGGQFKISIKNQIITRDFSSNGRQVKKGDYIVIDFIDNGQGIDPKLLKVIFNPFFSTKKDKGSGVGLASIAEILNEKKSFITVGTSPVGSKFTVYIPQV